MDPSEHFNAEARKISKILNTWDFGYLYGALKKYAHEEPHKRMQLVLKDYFNQSNINASPSALQADAKVIQSIFPEVNTDKIIDLLGQFCNEENRVRIVVQILLVEYGKNNNVNQTLKRSSPNDLYGDVVASKKSKITATVVSGAQDEDGPIDTNKSIFNDTDDSNSRSSGHVDLLTIVSGQDDSSTHSSEHDYLNLHLSEHSNESVESAPSPLQSNIIVTKPSIQSLPESQSTIIYSASSNTQEVMILEPLPDTSEPEQKQQPREQKKQPTEKQKEIDRLVKYLWEGTRVTNDEPEIETEERIGRKLIKVKDWGTIGESSSAAEKTMGETRVANDEPQIETEERNIGRKLIKVKDWGTTGESSRKLIKVEDWGTTGESLNTAEKTVGETSTTEVKVSIKKSVPAVSEFNASAVNNTQNIIVNVQASTNSGANTLTVQAPIQDAVSSSGDRSDNSADCRFNLYKHLKEMFTAISKKDIKAVCKIYNVSKHEKPNDERFSAIVTDLLSLASTSGSDDKSNESDKSSTEGVSTSNAAVEVKKQPAAATPPDNITTTTNLVVRLSADNPPEAPMDRDQRNLRELGILKITKFPPNATTISSTAQNVTQSIRIKFPATTQAAPVDLTTQQIPSATRYDLNQRYDQDDLDVVLRDLEDIDNVPEEISDEEEQTDNALLYPLMEMFPQACPRFLRKICQGKTNRPGVLDDLISQILEEDYPKRQKITSPEHRLDVEEQLEIMKQVLPDADPSYLQMHCERLVDKPEELKIFIAQAIENHSYPTMKDYLRKQQLSAQQKQYTTEFSVEKFLEVIPNPIEYFKDPKRKPAKADLDSHHYAISFLRNHFNKIQLRTIRDMFRKSSESFLATCKALENTPSSMCMKSKRALCEMPAAIQNIPLLQEIAYYEHHDEIEEYLDLKKSREAKERQEAKQKGLLQTCSCCFDDEVMPKDIYMCEYQCIFCKECVRRGAEVAFGDGKLDFACLNNCSSHFSLQTLQAVLLPKMFSKVALKKQLEEVKAAGIEDLETCPFCEFATIPAREDKLFRCFNPECMKESCRLCKEPSHVPLRCDEVEKDDDVKRRTYIENKMTEALLRTCYKCSKKFIKAEGCNKMTCSCGALMCYVCNQPVKDYKHFNGPGGDQVQLCPLYSDTNQLHQEAVLKGAEAAKQEIGITDAQLKIDPSADIQQHYQQIAKKNPPPPYVGVQHFDPFQVLNADLRNVQQRALQRMEEIRNQLRAHPNRFINPAVNQNIAHNQIPGNQGHRHHHHRHPHPPHRR